MSDSVDINKSKQINYEELCAEFEEDLFLHFKEKITAFRTINEYFLDHDNISWSNLGDKEKRIIINKSEILFNKKEGNEYLKDIHLLDSFCREYKEFIPGNDLVKKLIVFSCLGPNFKSPIHLAITGGQQKGKTYLLEETLDLFSNINFYSSASPKALIYECVDNPSYFDKKVIAIDDVDNTTNPEVLTTIKQLTTRKKDGVRTYITVKSQKSLKIHIGGDFSVIFTTADFPGDTQIKSRFLNIPCIINIELENTILDTMLLQGINTEVQNSKYKKFQEKWFKLFQDLSNIENYNVIIPFTCLLNKKPFLENKRLLTIYLELIRNSARFHYYTREKDDELNIIADFNDAIISFELLEDLFQYNNPDLKLTETMQLILKTLPMDYEIDTWLLDNQEQTSENITQLRSLTVKGVTAKINKDNKDVVLAESTVNNSLRIMYKEGTVNRHALKNGAAFRYFKDANQKNIGAYLLIDEIVSKEVSKKNESALPIIDINIINNNIYNILIKKKVYREDLFLQIKNSLLIYFDKKVSPISKTSLPSQKVENTTELTTSELTDESINPSSEKVSYKEKLKTNLELHLGNRIYSIHEIIKKFGDNNKTEIQTILKELIDESKIYEPKPEYFTSVG